MSFKIYVSLGSVSSAPVLTKEENKKINFVGFYLSAGFSNGISTNGSHLLKVTRLVMNRDLHKESG